MCSYVGQILESVAWAAEGVETATGYILCGGASQPASSGKLTKSESKDRRKRRQGAGMRQLRAASSQPLGPGPAPAGRPRQPGTPSRAATTAIPAPPID